MNLENIGFYTLTNERCKNASKTSPLWRNELIITSRCNFNCPYCRGTDINGVQGDMNILDIKKVIDFWASENIQNVRFSGGEPTIHPHFKEVIRYTKEKCIEIKNIAVSTNGYSDLEYYKELIRLGVSDFSISLDACCASIGDMMSGGVNGSWNKVVSNIKELSKMVYLSVGIVFDKDNTDTMLETIKFADSLGVSDIRIISSAQTDDFSIFKNLKIDEDILERNKILKYRVNHFKNGKNVRNMKETDFKKCGLLLDDMVIKGKYHYPCVIKMREGCEPIGTIDGNIREDRYEYFKIHNCYNDDICRKNCLDVCIDYNNKFMNYELDKVDLKIINEDMFESSLWESGTIHQLGIECRYDSITLDTSKELLKKHVIGWCKAEKLKYRPKENHVAVMCFVNGKHFWFHLRTNEFLEIFLVR